MSRPEQAAILCGGLGTRLRPYTDQLPKPMIPCNGKPFLWHLLNQIAEKGITRFLLMTGYRAEQIHDYFGNGHQWGWDIVYSNGPIEWDTGRRLWEAKDQINDVFLLLYADNFAPFPLERMLRFREKTGLPLTFMVSPKSPGNILINDQGVVERFDKIRSEETGYVELGYMIAEKRKLLNCFDMPDCNLTEILCKLVDQKNISAWIQPDTYHSISDPERWKTAEKYLVPKKILLIDRDGVINRKAPRGHYIPNWEQIEWISENREALKQLAFEGFKFIIITNQAGIARGMVNPIDLERIHKKMTQALERDGVEVLGIYVCPHHWDDKCWCRKPEPGMLFTASKEHLFRLDKTLFIGDDIRDCQTAWNAGCGSIYLGPTTELAQLSKYERPIFSAPNLLASINCIREYFNSVDDNFTNTFTR